MCNPDHFLLHKIERQRSQTSPVQQTVVTTLSNYIFGVLSCQTNLNPIVTDSSRRVISIELPITPSCEELLVILRDSELRGDRSS